MHIENRYRWRTPARERLTPAGKKAAAWSAWEVYEGTEGLTYEECREMIREWLSDPIEWLSDPIGRMGEEFRIVR